MTTNLIYACVHHMVFRAPYWSCDGAIEYAFNTLQTRLQMEINGGDTVFCLVNKINLIIGRDAILQEILFTRGLSG